MPYQENTPTFNSGRKVVNFKDFLSDPKAEEEKLKKAERSYTPNSDRQQFVRNSRTEYNPVTHKLTDYTEDEIEDKIKSIEELEETNESFDSEDKKIEIMNSLQDMFQERRSTKLYKWIDSLSEEELNVIYNSIEKNGLLSKF